MMTTHFTKGLLLLLVGGSTLSCQKEQEKKDAPEERLQTVLKAKINEVTVQPLEKKDFHHELVSNGKLKANRHAELRFETAEVIENIYVKNGAVVKEGEKLASLYTFELQNQLEQRKEAMQRSYLDLQDVLIGQGYSIEDSTSIPKEVMELARIKSGYVQAVNQYKLAAYELDRATLRAPFAGVVANLTQRSHNMASTAEPFCTVIDQNSLQLEFALLESELALVHEGDRVVVSPFSDPTKAVNGQISEVNPVVDDNGMVQVKAQIMDAKGLFEGMNARVRIQRIVPNQLVIPKTALVLRSGKEVVFVLREEKAYWVYVKKLMENSDSFVVESKDFKENDVIITTGNVNLAHEAPVSVVNAR